MKYLGIILCIFVVAFCGLYFHAGQQAAGYSSGKVREIRGALKSSPHWESVMHAGGRNIHQDFGSITEGDLVATAMRWITYIVINIMNILFMILYFRKTQKDKIANKEGLDGRHAPPNQP